jgi:hypothetical protein
MLSFWFRFGLSGACFPSWSYLLKRKSPAGTATTDGFFSSRLAPFCNNPLNRVRVYAVEQPS